MKFFKRNKNNKKITTYHPMAESISTAIWKNGSVPIGIEIRIARLDDKTIDEALFEEIIVTLYQAWNGKIELPDDWKDVNFSTEKIHDQADSGHYHCNKKENAK